MVFKFIIKFIKVFKFIIIFKFIKVFKFIKINGKKIKFWSINFSKRKTSNIYLCITNL